MTRTTIINKLRPYLSDLFISRLQMATYNNKDLVLCMVITDIYREVELGEDEEVVSELLTKLVSICF